MKVVSIFLAIVLCYFLVDYKSTEAYNKGHTVGFSEGVTSVKKPDVDQMCVKWMFNTNLKAAKKRICTKGRS